MSSPDVRSTVVHPMKTRARRQGTRRDHTSIARQFQADVMEGRFPCGAIFRRAVERQINDEQSPPTGYEFRPDLGARACRFFELLPYHEGPKRGQKFRLEAWQVWLHWVFYGWVDSVTEEPRFRTAYWWIPKGNGKSPVAAMNVLYGIAPSRHGDKAYSAASTQKQARHVFDAAREMLRLAPDVCEKFALVVEEHKIKGENDNRVAEPVSSEAGSNEGIRPKVIVLDETHVQADRKLFDNLKSATDKVEGSRFISISTAGLNQNPEAIGWEIYRRTRDILLGTIDDPTTFAVIVEADRDRSPDDPETWRQANPNLGVSVSLAGIKAAMQYAREVPSGRYEKYAKHLGWWAEAGTALFDMERWKKLANPTISADDFSGWTLFVGVDLARTRDLTAAVFLFARARDDGKREYRLITRGTVYLPEQSDTIGRLPDVPFQRWADDGWLTLVGPRAGNARDGDSMSYAPVREAIFSACRGRSSVEVCIDEWSAAELAVAISNEGHTPVAIRQGAKTQSEPTRELEAAILDGRIEHDGSPVTEWCLSNTEAHLDRNGNVAPQRKDRSELNKIDVAVATINAMVRASVAELGAGAPLVSFV